MSVVFDRPYQFISPHTGHWWPDFIQAFRIYDWYLRYAEGVTRHEIRGLSHFAEPLQRGDGIVLTPNHCRYADPLILGWPARRLKTHLHAVASWHLFNRGGFDQFALRRMGAFSLHRESLDRQSIDTAIEIIASASRPLVMFPEGATYRTNDVLKPLLDGVAFIARTAARRAARRDRDVKMIPVAIKYLCLDPLHPWADHQLRQFERSFGWRSLPAGEDLLIRVDRVASAVLGLIESRFDCRGQGDTLHRRRRSTINQILQQCEDRLGISTKETDDAATRARVIRAKVVSDYFSETASHDEALLRRCSDAADAVLDLAAYPEDYLDRDQATDTRVVETIQRLQEFVHGKADASMRLRAIIEFDEPIEVPPEKSPRGTTDPLMTRLEQKLSGRLEELSRLANPLG